jgi:hypothetical protein
VGADSLPVASVDTKIRDGSNAVTLVEFGEVGIYVGVRGDRRSSSENVPHVRFSLLLTVLTSAMSTSRLSLCMAAAVSVEVSTFNQVEMLKNVSGENMHEGTILLVLLHPMLPGSPKRI